MSMYMRNKKLDCMHLTFNYDSTKMYVNKLLVGDVHKKTVASVTVVMDQIELELHVVLFDLKLD